jgi:hypothetical protein
MIALLQNKSIFPLRCYFRSVFMPSSCSEWVLLFPQYDKSMSMPLQPLEVVLVNSKSRLRPINAEKMAQNNLDGGGNTSDERHSSTPLPTLGDQEQFSPEQSAHRVKQLEQEAKRLLTQLKSNYSVARETDVKQPRQRSKVAVKTW